MPVQARPAALACFTFFLAFAGRVSETGLHRGLVRPGWRSSLHEWRFQEGENFPQLRFAQLALPRRHLCILYLAAPMARLCPRQSAADLDAPAPDARVRAAAAGPAAAPRAGAPAVAALGGPGRGQKARRCHRRREVASTRAQAAGACTLAYATSSLRCISQPSSISPGAGMPMKRSVFMMSACACVTASAP